MNKLTLADLVMALRHLLRTRRAEIDAIGAARGLAADLLDPTLARLEAIPAARETTPNVVELADVDAEHDGYARAARLVLEAVLSLPSSTEAQRTQARTLLETFVPTSGQLRASYAAEAARAAERQPKVEAARTELEAIQVPNGNLYAWLTAYVARGARLAVLLEGRADATPDRSEVQLLRGRAISQLSILREVVRDALSATADRGAATDTRLFGYIDLLAGMRAGGSTAPTPAPPADPSPARPG